MLDRSRSLRWTFVLLAVALLCVVFAGFAPSYYLRSDDKPPLSTLFFLHGAVFTAWYLLFFLQTVLIRTKQVALHRGLGLASILLVPPLIVLGMGAAFDALERGVTILSYPPATFFFMSASDMAGFLVLFGAGVALRKHGPQHKRLMAFASVSLILPAAGRVADQFGAGPLGAGIQLAFVFALIAYDLRTEKTVLGATLFGAGLIGCKLLGIITVGVSRVWIDFVDWFQ